MHAHMCKQMCLQSPEEIMLDHLLLEDGCGHEMLVMGVEHLASTRAELPFEWLRLTFKTGPPMEVHWLVSDSPGSACPNLPGSRDTDSLCLL